MTTSSEQSDAGDNGGAFTGANGTGYAYNTAQVTDSRADYGTSPYTYGSQVYMRTGGDSARGSKAAFSSTLLRIAPDDTNFPARDDIGGIFISQSVSPQGGTSTGGGARGSCFAASMVAQLQNGAANYGGVSGGEVDVGILSPASASARWGWQLVGTGDTRGAAWDAAIEIGATFSWGAGIIFGNFHGAAPVTTTGTLIGSDGSSVTVANGFYFPTYTFTGAIIEAGGFKVTAGGNVTLSASATPQINFAPSAGATKVAQIYQSANAMYISDAGVADRVSINLSTGDVSLLTGNLHLANSAASITVGGNPIATQAYVDAKIAELMASIVAKLDELTT